MNRSNLGPLLLLGVIAVGYVALRYPIMFTYLLLAALVMLALGIAFVFGYDAFWLVRNRFSPIVHIQAKVIRRRTVPWDVSIVGESPEMWAARMGLRGRNPGKAAKAYLNSAAKDLPEIEVAGGNDYFVTFAFSGREEEFLVPEDAYVRCEEGSEGLLVFRGEQFRHFIPDVE